MSSPLGGSLGRLVGHTSVYIIGGVLPAMLNILLLPILTRYLSPQEYGILSYASTVAGVYSLIAALSFPSFLLRHYYECRSAQESRLLFGTIFGFLILYNLALIGIASVIMPPIFRALGVQVPFHPYMSLALTCAAIETLGLIPLTYYRVVERPVSVLGFTAAFTVLTAGLSLYLVVDLRMGLLGRFYGQLLADLILLVVYVAVMRRVASLRWSARYLRQAFVFALPLVPAQLIATLSGGIDRLMLERLAPIGQLGVYAVAKSLTQGVTIISNGVYRTLEPHAYRAASEDNLDSYLVFMRRHIGWLLALLVFAGVAASSEVLTVLAGPAYRGGVGLLPLLFVGAGLGAFTSLQSTYLIGCSRTWYETPIRAVATISAAASMLVLVPLFGLIGAAMSYVLVTIVTAVGFDVAIRRHATGWSSLNELALIVMASVAGYLVNRIDLGFGMLTVCLKAVLILLAMFAVGVRFWREMKATSVSPKVLADASAAG
jgi:O-antigen/teichoic acid export membrane protein